MSKTIQLQGTKGEKPITILLSGDTLQIEGTRYRLNKYDYTTLSIWVDDNKPVYNNDRRYTGDYR